MKSQLSCIFIICFIFSGLLLVKIPLVFAKPNEKLSTSEAIALAIIDLSNKKTGLSTSHLGHPGYENVTFLYDQMVNALVLKAIGKQTEAEVIVDFFANRLKVPHKDIIKRVDTNNIFGILKIFLDNESEHGLVMGLVNAIDKTSNEPAGRGMLEYWTTPGPLSFVIFAMLHINPDKYINEAILLGETLIFMQMENGGIQDGDRMPGVVHTEPHMDGYAAFIQLYELTGDPKWRVAADKALQWFYDEVFIEEAALIHQGMRPTGASTIFATDAYTWTMAGPAGDIFSLKTLDRLTTRLLDESLTRVTLRLPDERIETLYLSDFTNPTEQPALDARNGFRPMGSIEWTGGKILALQKNAVRFSQSDDPYYQEQARYYKAVAEILIKEVERSFYSVKGVKGKITFYATGQGVDVGHGWKTPFYFYKKGESKKMGGSVVGAWPILAMEGLNPFILNDDYFADYQNIPVDQLTHNQALSKIRTIAMDKSFEEFIPSDVPHPTTQIVEPAHFNRYMLEAFVKEDYHGAIAWAERVLADRSWVLMAQRDQEVKNSEVGGLIFYRWGVGGGKNKKIDDAIWRYPMLNEVGTAMWGLAMSQFMLGKKDIAKQWIRRIIDEVPFHQIYAKNGPGYWNALISWEYNPSKTKKSKEFKDFYFTTLNEMNLESASPLTLPVTDIDHMSPSENFGLIR